MFRQIDWAKWKWQKDTFVLVNTIFEALAAATSKSIRCDVGDNWNPERADASLRPLNKILYDAKDRVSIAAKQTDFIPEIGKIFEDAKSNLELKNTPVSDDQPWIVYAWVKWRGAV